MTSRRRRPTPPAPRVGNATTRRPPTLDWRHSVAAGLVALAVTLPLTPDFSAGKDAGEFTLVLARFGAAHPTGYPLYTLAGGVFVLEALSVMLQTGWFKYTRIRYGEGRRIFLMSPLHHHFEKKGWYESQVVMRFYILCVLFAVVALATLKLR